MNVELSNEEHAMAKEWGTLRTRENIGRSDIASYDPRRFNLTSLQNNRLGVLVELAWYKHLGYDTANIDYSVWVPFVETKDYDLLKGPDVAGKFEVRRANLTTNPIPVRLKDKAYGAFVVQGHVHYAINGNGSIRVPRNVTFLGWADSVADWDSAEVPAWSAGDSKVVSNKRSMDTLPIGVSA